jgi:hypothetical protein
MEEIIMNLINELRTKSEIEENKKEAVIAEIKTFFDKILNSERFEEHLKRYIDASDIKRRKTFMNVEFWEYHDGCSTTSFRCGGITWYNPENKDGYKSHSYKGIELCDINKEVCGYLTTRLINRMNELGFYLVSKEDQKGRFGYYHTNFYFGW